ncbi:MAG: GNAT family N-acyltransferase [Paracoccus sp. (in: a-proteobacteria)]|uniref:GNAT family N-acetyltransferase n=1 Tax=Paracoccus sp. TaxID=267 RepID=UPI0026E089BB|nr:GNAT family N-acyltransferase [Paracoccus sp. (in: a-proteobacteria)]MDO5631291.1 GNAT family N-acyltransferase [Paracoccus sp. (in: a-proteobacteria)]
MAIIVEGRYRARLAETAQDLRNAQRLRWRCFLGRTAPDDGDGLDADAMDAECNHLLIEDTRTGELVACCRFLALEKGADIGRSYSAQYYDLGRLAAYDTPMVEIGRFCVDPARRDPDILRLAWRALSQQIDAARAGLLFGCSSFVGTEPDQYADAFAMLRARHLAPRRWLPRVKAPQVFRFARALRMMTPDPRRAMAAMPPLLRSYLAMGGWVSDHAVVDRHLNTLHVFTGVEIGAIPPARQRWLRGTA